MGYGDPETPQEEIRAIIDATERLANDTKSLANCIHFFACSIHHKDYETFKNDVSVWLYEMCGNINQHQSSVIHNMKDALTLINKLENSDGN